MPFRATGTPPVAWLEMLATRAASAGGSAPPTIACPAVPGQIARRALAAAGFALMISRSGATALAGATQWLLIPRELHADRDRPVRAVQDVDRFTAGHFRVGVAQVEIEPQVADRLVDRFELEPLHGRVDVDGAGVEADDLADLVPGVVIVEAGQVERQAVIEKLVLGPDFDGVDEFGRIGLERLPGDRLGLIESAGLVARANRMRRTCCGR